MRLYLLVCTLLGAPLVFSFSAFSNSTDAARTAIEQWVETQRIASAERTSWALERRILRESLDLLTREQERLDAALADLAGMETAVDAERTRLAAEREAFEAAAAVVSESLGPLEERLRGLVARFPDPLRAQVQNLARRIPEDPENTRLSIGERVQNVVGILGEADRFNNAITLTREIRELDSGTAVEVRTLYLGLGAAYFADPTGRIGGIGLPGATGWEWTQADASAPAIARLIDVYEGVGEIRFIEIPARVSNL